MAVDLELRVYILVSPFVSFRLGPGLSLFPSLPLSSSSWSRRVRDLPVLRGAPSPSPVAAPGRACCSDPEPAVLKPFPVYAGMAQIREALRIVLLLMMKLDLLRR